MKSARKRPLISAWIFKPRENFLLSRNTELLRPPMSCSFFYADTNGLHGRHNERISISLHDQTRPDNPGHKSRCRNRIRKGVSKMDRSSYFLPGKGRTLYSGALPNLRLRLCIRRLLYTAMLAAAVIIGIRAVWVIGHKPIHTLEALPLCDGMAIKRSDVFYCAPCLPRSVVFMNGLIWFNENYAEEK